MGEETARPNPRGWCLHLFPADIPSLLTSWAGSSLWGGCPGPCTMFGSNSGLYLGLPGWLRGKESACNAGDVGLIPESGRSPGIGNGNTL